MDNLTGLSLGRIAFGAAAFAAPRAGLRTMTFRSDAPQAQYLLRLFGVRDLALGVLTLAAPPSQRPALVKAGIAVDLGDALAGSLLLRHKAVRTPVGVGLSALGAIAAVTGVVALGQQQHR